MDLTGVILAILHYLFDGVWLYYDFSDRKTHRKNVLHFVGVVIAVSVGFMALGLEFLEQILEILNTPVGSIGFWGLQSLPIVGVVATGFLCALTCVKLWDTWNNPNLKLSTQAKWNKTLQDGIHIFLQLACIAITIALLAFPPTGIALVATLLAISLVGVLSSAYRSYKQHQEAFHAAQETSDPSRSASSCVQNRPHKAPSHEDSLLKSPSNSLDRNPTHPDGRQPYD